VARPAVPRTGRRLDLDILHLRRLVLGLRAHPAPGAVGRDALREAERALAALCTLRRAERRRAA